jgi:PhzF family phenazine biosynthesis protein
LRWFTPVAEVDLCGHATLASAFVLFDVFGHASSSIVFETRSGKLICSREGRLITMDFPARAPAPCPCPGALTEGLGKEPAEVLSADDYVAVYGAEEDVRNLSPDFSKLRELGLRGVVVTAPGIQCDFVSRFFAPKFGIDEDPVTGSAHCELAPYWCSRLGKTRFKARQLSRRGGEIHCEVRGDRVLISGRAVKFMEAEIAVEM